MNRRQFLHASSFALAAAALPLKRQTARRVNTFHPLRRNVGFYTNQGGTIGYLVAPEARVVIDTQFPEPAATFWQGLQEREVDRIDLLINTHHHGDHTAGNGVLQPHAERHLAHRNVPDLQRQAARNGSPTVPNVLFEEQWQEDLGDETITARHYGPAHTGGDAVIHFVNADVVHMGDLVFNRRAPFVDGPGGASVQGWAQTLEQVYEAHSDETIFIFGHAGDGYEVIGSRADLLAMRDFLTAVLEHVQQGLQAGQSKDEIMQVETLPGVEAYISTDRPQLLAMAVEVAYQDLAEED